MMNKIKIENTIETNLAAIVQLLDVDSSTRALFTDNEIREIRGSIEFLVEDFMISGKEIVSITIDRDEIFRAINRAKNRLENYKKQQAERDNDK